MKGRSAMTGMFSPGITAALRAKTNAAATVAPIQERFAMKGR
jgi:hypothetical protein